MRPEDVQAWYGTKLGLQEFVRLVKSRMNEEEYALFLRWASRREPHLSEAEIERMEARAEEVAAFLGQREVGRFPRRGGASQGKAS